MAEHRKIRKCYNAGACAQALFACGSMVPSLFSSWLFALERTTKNVFVGFHSLNKKCRAIVVSIDIYSMLICNLQPAIAFRELV
jgi:hypothetical protein